MRQLVRVLNTKTNQEETITEATYNALKKSGIYSPLDADLIEETEDPKKKENEVVEGAEEGKKKTVDYKTITVDELVTMIKTDDPDLTQPTNAKLKAVVKKMNDITTEEMKGLTKKDSLIQFIMNNKTRL